MQSVRFFVSWIFSSLAMFGASYWWHGIFLTDFSKLHYPKGIFLTIACLVYLLLGFLLSKGYELKIFGRFSSKPFLRGTMAGASLGVIIFSISFVTGVNFNSQITMQILFLDFVWQILEQTLGGFIVGCVYFFIVGKFAYED